ncbi:LLM class flavin-dependent oxidoreductase [Rhodococcus sp. WAY2]|uniref:LLM class flavin-dependent oxidoreductase n=1 Tax=Rhodococcus sp. WAY2 TaxID=2663121 RepID=UPI00131F6E94|nr:LLM class flavin-dependent oxidoreductase [Rhodococcus sp. WAY2]QHE73539.1 N5,N10-methylenetetrahydromethanopterin reductase-related protein [Rhodococcus sp. WAY2]
MNGFRTGVMDCAIHPRFAPDLLLRTTRAVATAGGADSMWLPDHLNSLFPASVWKPAYSGAAKLLPRANAYYEPWTALGYVAAHNKLARLRLGVGVTDAGRRNPAVTAQAAATLHLLSRGRAILGFGPGEREGNQPYGVDWSRPVGRFEEAIATIRALWNSGGEPVTRDSKYFPLRSAVFDLPPFKGRRPPIWVAGHGSRMLQITGRYADAWFPGYAQSPKQYAEKLDTVRAAADNTGRNPHEILPATFFFVLAARTNAQVDEMIDSVLARVGALVAPAEVWARHGVEHPLGSDFTGAQDILPQTIDEHTALAYAERVPRSLVRETFLVGTPTDIVEQLAQWRDSGARYAVLANIGGFHPHLGVGLASSFPLIQVLRNAKRL